MINVLLLVSALALTAAPPTQAASPAADAPLERLLDRGNSLPPGTYAVNGDGIVPAESAIPVIVQADVLRGRDKTIRVPIAIGTEVRVPSSVRLRVVTAGGGAPRVAGEATGAGEPGHVRLVHDFTLAPGTYDVYAVVGPRRAEGSTVAALARMRLTVPDVWNGPLAVTPVVVGDGVVRAPGANPQAFTFGATTLSPTVTDRFPPSGSVNVGLRIFNWSTPPGAKAEEAKPDVTVEYLFYEQTSKRRAFFNKVKPQRLAADTLAKEFDPATGMVTAGVNVPLLSFPFGDFALKVRVTDNRSKRTAEQEVRFVVAP
jgi:hypothetical protein